PRCYASPPYCIEIPAGNVMLQIGSCPFHADERDAGFHQDRLLRLRRKFRKEAEMSPFSFTAAFQHFAGTDKLVVCIRREVVGVHSTLYGKSIRGYGNLPYAESMERLGAFQSKVDRVVD